MPQTMGQYLLSRESTSPREEHILFHAVEDGSCYRALVVEVLVFAALDALSGQGVPQLPSQGRLMNKLLNNIVGGNFPVP